MESFDLFEYLRGTPTYPEPQCDSICDRCARSCRCPVLIHADRPAISAAEWTLRDKEMSHMYDKVMIEDKCRNFKPCEKAGLKIAWCAQRALTALYNSVKASESPESLERIKAGLDGINWIKQRLMED